MNIGQISDQTAYVCDRTLWGLRDLISRKGLHDEMFQRITQKLAKVHHVDTSLQRLDAVHLFSNMRHLGRIRLFVCTLQKFLRSLKRHFPGFAGWGRLDKMLIEGYQEKHPGSCFAMVKPSESSRTLQQMADDLLTLVQCFRKDAAVCQKASYKLLLRVLAEQCVVAEAGEAAEKVVLKPSKDIAADSLQNPSDPEAGYDAHKGQGYQAQVCETYSRDPDKPSLSLITYVATESAANSDANALSAVIDDLQSRDRGATELLCDALYGGDDNQQKAAEKGVEVVAPMMGRKPGPDKAVGLADFKVGKKSATCPRGFSSEKVKQNKHSTTLIFNSKVCRKCPLLSGCPVQQATVGFYVRVDAKALRVAQRRAYEKTPAFREV